MSDPSIPIGLCQCGCGQPTPRAKRSYRAYGQVKGRPVRYVNGHNTRKSSREYTPEDRGHETPCWIWSKALSGNGYGAAYREGRVLGAHRMMYERLVGSIPEGEQIDHLCQVKTCVNPDHMQTVMQTVNLRRKSSTKLDWAKVKEMRRLHGAGVASPVELAARYGVNPSVVSNVIHNRAWRE